MSSFTPNSADVGCCVTKAAIILALRALLVVQPQAHALLRAVAMPTRPPGAVFPIERHFENDRRLAAHARTRRGDGEGDRVVIGMAAFVGMREHKIDAGNEAEDRVGELRKTQRGGLGR